MSFCLDVFVLWLVLVLDRSMLLVFMPAHVVDEIRGVPRYLLGSDVRCLNACGGIFGKVHLVRYGAKEHGTSLRRVLS